MIGPVSGLADRLSERDNAILLSLEQFRLLDTRQIQRLHFADHASHLAAARATARSLRRLTDLRVVTTLERRIGGVRRGSASYVWQLSAAGERFLRARQGEARRRRFMEPGATFVNHTLAVNEVAVQLLEAGRDVQGLTVERLVTEPRNWRSYLGADGELQWLKPDLHAVISATDAEGEYEEHAFLEIDLGSEHLPRIQAKCRTYAAYAATGIYQAEHDVFPAVIWLSESPTRRAAIRSAIAGARGLPHDLFRVSSREQFVSGLHRHGSETKSQDQRGGQKGGTPS